MSEEEKKEQFEISDDLQRDIINLTITNRSFLISSISLVIPEYFTDIARQQICKIVQSYFSEYNQLITLDILQQEIKKKFSDNSQYPRILAELDIIIDRTNEAHKEIEYLTKAVSEFAKNQAMKSAIIKSVDYLESRQYDKIEELIRQALLVASNNSLGTNLFDDVDERYRRIISEMHGEKFTTSFETLDRDLNGGISRKEIAMIFAPSGVGKSVYLTMAAIANVAKGKNVLYISCEMSEDRVAMRADAMSTFIPIGDLISKLPTVKERLEIFSQESNGKLVIKEFPAGTASINDMRAYTNQLYNYTGFKPDVIVLDYIDEIKCSKSLPNLHQEQQVSTRDFRAWMTMDNYAGFTATQANREGTQVQIIKEGQIGDSYGKVRIVEALWSLNQNDEENAKGVARLFVVKNRNGRKKYLIYLKIDPYNLRMKEIKESEYETIMGKKPPKEVLDEVNT